MMAENNRFRNGRTWRAQSILRGLVMVTLIVAKIDAQQEGRQQSQQSGSEQMQHDHEAMGHAGMQMPGMDHMHMNMNMNEAGMFLMNQASGTSMNPLSWPMPMVNKQAGSWNFMFMAEAFVADTQQSGPRGRDKFYSVNWGMISAERDLGRGAFMFQFMPSLEPATVTSRRYPELFQTGETAFGKPIVDGQHPHNFFMNLGLNYARPLSEDAKVQVYYAPVGDPALGPVAFPHRASASELPQAGLGHHWQDSSHIAANVLTAAIKYKIVRLEASGFYGTEPGENRWTIDWGPMNSWSSRLSVFPSKNWMGQVSAGRLAKPERQEEGDVLRSTASLHYTRPFGDGTSWSTSLIWGRNHRILDKGNSNSYLLESVIPFRRRNRVTGRIEVVDKDELFADQPELRERLARTIGSSFRIEAYTLGYTRDVRLFRNVATGIGANLTAYTLPGAIQPYYGEHPFGVNVFLRLRLQPGQ